jgi:hypothetical protein
MSTRIESAIAAVVALIALSAFSYQISEQRSQNREKDVREWQRVVAYKVLLGSPTPLSFEQTYGAYLDEVKNREYRQVIPSKEIRKEALLRVLLELRQNHIVGLDAFDQYYVRHEADAGVDELMKQMWTTGELQRLEPLALRMIMDSDRRYNEAELYLEIKRVTNTPLPEEQFSRLINSLLDRGRVLLTPDRLLHPVFDEYVDDEEMGEAEGGEEEFP